MATSYKTPGVYVEEIPKLPPSVAQVETAIPAFIGYTQRASKNGESLLNIPTEVESLVEFETWFGGAYQYRPGDINVVLDEGNNFAVTEVEYTDKVFYLYDAMRLFYDNGGGKCYVVAVGLHEDDIFTGGMLDDSADLVDGLRELEKYDEPTIIVIPDAVSLPAPQLYGLQQAVLAQCAKLQDRVGVLDLNENANDLDYDEVIDEFRDNIGISNLKYGMAYTPWLLTSYARTVDFDIFRDNVFDLTDQAIDLSKDITTDIQMNTAVVTATNASEDLERLRNDVNTLQASTNITAKEKYNTLRTAVMRADAAGTETAFRALMTHVRTLAMVFPAWAANATQMLNEDLRKAINAAAYDPQEGLRRYVTDLIALEKNTAIDDLLANFSFAAYNDVPLADADSWLGMDVADIPANPANYGTTGTDAAKRSTVITALPDVDLIFNGLYEFLQKMVQSAATYKKMAQDALYANHPVVSNIVKAIIVRLSKTPPSGAIAGIYARVDNARGVWKAPANESINSVIGPSVQITADQQAEMNVDPVAGKSINAIRTFTGKGTLVWGARTLAGNDNEWRYVSVRRFFNMVEESSKKASEPFVFEPNDANTWVKVQGMLENFLTILWRQGALQGAKPEHAFYVAVGLGKTMTALDILEGRMIVEIGMAVVRPAEFIILRFSHKMAES